MCLLYLSYNDSSTHTTYQQYDVWNKIKQNKKPERFNSIQMLIIPIRYKFVIYPYFNSVQKSTSENSKLSKAHKLK